MYRAFIIVIAVVASMGGFGFVGYQLGLRRRPPDLTPIERQRLLDEMHRLVGLSREALERGDLGLANIYEQAAQNIVSQPTKDHP